MLRTKKESSKNKRPSQKVANDDWLKLYGAWNDMEFTAEALIDLIENSRTSSREIESLD